MPLPQPLRNPLLRVLSINLGIGLVAALLMFGGLLALNPQNLRTLILSDRSPILALGLLLFGLLITFGSAAMGSGVMLLQHDDSDCGSRQPIPTLSVDVPRSKPNSILR